MASDLSEYHGLNLVNVLRDGSHSPRLLLAYLEHLPDTSALAASLRSEPRGWGSDRHLLATVVDAVQVNTWVTQASNSKKKPPKPKPITRPTAKKKPAARVVRIRDLK